MNIDLNRIENIKEELESLNEGDVLYVNEDKQTKYVIMPIEMYEEVEDMLMIMKSLFLMIILKRQKAKLI